LDCIVINDSFWTGPKGCQMRTDQIADVWRELRRKPSPRRRLASYGGIGLDSSTKVVVFADRNA
jgi:hypothetical protein